MTDIWLKYGLIWGWVPTSDRHCTSLLVADGAKAPFCPFALSPLYSVMVGTRPPWISGAVQFMFAGGAKWL